MNQYFQSPKSLLYVVFPIATPSSCGTSDPLVNRGHRGAWQHSLCKGFKHTKGEALPACPSSLPCLKAGDAV